MSAPQFLIPRSGETDEERRLREAIETHASKLMHTLDSAMALRQAPADAQRLRHRIRGGLQDVCLQAMHAHQLAKQSPHKG